MLENKGRLGQDKQRNLPFAIRWDALGQMKQKGHIIRHFHIDHNAPCLPPAIKKKKNCITIVSNLSWVLGSSLEKSKTVVMHFFGRGGGGGTRCLMVSVKMANGVSSVPVRAFFSSMRFCTT